MMLEDEGSGDQIRFYCTGEIVVTALVFCVKRS